MAHRHMHYRALAGLGAIALLASGLSGCATYGGGPGFVATPVYIATLDPSGLKKQTLVAGRPTVLTFSIGQPDPANIIRAEQAVVNPSILNSTEEVPLVVTLNCLVCSGNSLQMAPIIYYPKRTRSTPASFQLTPRNLDVPRHGHIVIDVARNAVPVDHFVIDIEVVSANTLPTTSEQATQIFLNPRGLASADDASTNVGIGDAAGGVDVVLTLKQSRQGPLAVVLQPLSSRAIQILGPKLGNTPFREFPTRLLTINDLDRVVKDAYLRLHRTLSPGDVSSSETAQPLDDKSGYVDAGRHLYDYLFNTADKHLLNLIRLLEQSSPVTNPYRLQIVTQGFYLPWQLLIPLGGSIDQAWGFTFEIAVLPPVLSPGPLPGRMMTPHIGKTASATAYLQYHTANLNRDDWASTLGDEFYSFLEAKVGSSQFVATQKGNEFVRTLASAGSLVEFVIAFTHGSSGTQFARDSAGNLILRVEEAGPRLLLGTDNVRPFDLDRLRESAPRDNADDPILRQRPFVLLNACETGTAGASPTVSSDFPGAWLNLGARGVITTEAPVDMFQGYAFTKKLVTALLDGEKAISALRRLRSESIRDGSPFGLLYSYYGSPWAALK
jgi:hypothetical protein